MIADTDGGDLQVHYLTSEPASVSEARRVAGAAAQPYLEPDQFAAFELVVSEIVSNAVRHGAAPDGRIKMSVTPKDGYMCLQVTDTGPGLVPRPGAMAPEPDDGGFGLFIVEQLTRRWGVTREGSRTRVWCELDFSGT